MRQIAIIPSRYGSSRFPGKPLQIIAGKPMIEYVYKNTIKAKRLDDVYVATDDDRIYNCVKAFGGKAVMTSKDIACGTDRVGNCAKILGLTDEDIVYNIQGDEPLIRSEMIDELIDIFDDSDVYMGTLKKKIESDEELNNPNIVKVVSDKNDNAIYFSRYSIPYDRDNNRIDCFKHIGVYGYKNWFLQKFISLERTPLELSESLEQLRVIENGYKIRVHEIQYYSLGVDVKEQISVVEKAIIQTQK